MTEKTTANSVMVFYINVGQMPPYQAEAFLKRIKDQFLQCNNDIWKLPDDVGTLFIPVRPPQECRVDYIPMTGASVEAITALKEVRDQLREEYDIIKFVSVEPKRERRGFFGGIRHWVKSLFP